MVSVARMGSCVLLGGCALVMTTSCRGVPNCVETPKAVDVEYVLAEYRIGSESARMTPAEVSDTPAYKTERPNIKKIAIRFPDSCHEAGAAVVTGKAGEANGTTIFKSNCGVWLGELERSLSASGFIVYSSDAVHQLEKQGKSAYVAAAELGADVVIMFNSLEAKDVKAGTLAGTRFLYFKSNEKGEEGPALPLPETLRAYFRTFIKARKEPKGAEPVVALAAILDATAILAKPMGSAAAGESIWFYRRSMTRPLKSAGSMRFLFARTATSEQWLVAAPDLPTVREAPPPPPSSEDVSMSATTDVSDAYAVERLALVRESATDFVARFAGKNPK